MTERAKKLLLLYYEQSKKNRTIQGSPPLTFKAKKAGTLKDYRIYGNTANGESVGDKTENLFDGELTNGYHLGDTTGLPTSFTSRFATLQPITINQSEYRLTYNSTTNLRFMYSVFNNDTLIRRVALVNNRYLQSGDAIDTTGGNKIYFAFYNNDQSRVTTEMISNIMLNSGSTPLPYEPYGYKVPVTVEGKNLYEITKFANGSVSQTVSGITFTISNNKVIYSGTSTAAYPQILSPELPLIPGQSYYAKIIVKGSYEGQIYIYFRGSQVEGGTNQNYKQILPGTEEVFTVWYNTCVLYVAQGNTRHFDASVEVVITKVPSVTTPIYLPEPIKMVGDEAEYIDYAEQKQHRVRKNYFQSSDFEAGAIYSGQGWKNITYQDSKTPSGMQDAGQVVFYTTRKRSTDLITIIGTYTISIADGWEFGIVMFPNDRNSGELFIYNTEPVTISNCTFAIQFRKTDVSDISSADISDYKIMLNKGSTPLPYEPYIENTEVDVTLPELPTLAGTNTLTVGTEVQPSGVEIKGRIKAAGGD